MVSEKLWTGKGLLVRVVHLKSNRLRTTKLFLIADPLHAYELQIKMAVKVLTGIFNLTDPYMLSRSAPSLYYLVNKKVAELSKQFHQLL